MPMTILQFITSPIYGCCNTSELMAFSKQDKDGFNTLKNWAAEEMKARGLDAAATADVMVPKTIN